MDSDPAHAQHLRRDARPTRRWPATASACASSASRSSNCWAANAFIRHGSCPAESASPLTAENRDQILAGIPEALAIATRALDWFKSEMERFREEIRSFANFPTLFMGLVGDDGGLEHYDGKLRFLDAGGHIVADSTGHHAIPTISAEIAHPWSYLKTSFYKPLGYPEGVYRVGPLARLNIIDGMRHAARQPGVGRVPRAGSRRGAQFASTTTTRA